MVVNNGLGMLFFVLFCSINKPQRMLSVLSKFFAKKRFSVSEDDLIFRTNDTDIESRTYEVDYPDADYGENNIIVSSLDIRGENEEDEIADDANDNVNDVHQCEHQIKKVVACGSKKEIFCIGRGNFEKARKSIEEAMKKRLHGITQDARAQKTRCNHHQSVSRNETEHGNRVKKSKNISTDVSKDINRGDTTESEDGDTIRKSPSGTLISNKKKRGIPIQKTKRSRNNITNHIGLFDGKFPSDGEGNNIVRRSDNWSFHKK